MEFAQHLRTALRVLYIPGKRAVVTAGDAGWIRRTASHLPDQNTHKARQAAPQAALDFPSSVIETRPVPSSERDRESALLMDELFVKFVLMKRAAEGRDNYLREKTDPIKSDRSGAVVRFAAGHSGRPDFHEHVSRNPDRAKARRAQRLRICRRLQPLQALRRTTLFRAR